MSNSRIIIEATPFNLFIPQQSPHYPNCLFKLEDRDKTSPDDIREPSIKAVPQRFVTFNPYQDRAKEQKLSDEEKEKLARYEVIPHDEFNYNFRQHLVKVEEQSRIMKGDIRFKYTYKQNGFEKEVEIWDKNKDEAAKQLIGHGFKVDMKKLVEVPTHPQDVNPIESELK